LRILVLGASGFIGSNFVKQAVAAGHEILALSRKAGDLPIKYAIGTLENPAWKEIRAFKAEACVHTAWITTPGIYLQSELNASLKKWSLSFLATLAQEGLKHALVLGTCIEYAMTGKLLDEIETPTEPRTPYAKAKCELHTELSAAFAKTSSSLAWARIFYPYGVGEDPERLPSQLIRTLRRGEDLVLKTPDSVKDYIHVSDVAAALLSIVSKKAAGTFNVGIGEGVRVEDIARKIAAALGRDSLVKKAEVHSPDPYAFVVANSTRLRSLGWKPKMSLDSGLAQMVEQ
jgi:nucleoside-diphosphate-sugar epimerase